MRFATWILAASFALCGGVTTTLSAAEPSSPKPEGAKEAGTALLLLEKDERLRQAVSIKRRYCTLGEALEQLGHQTRVKLQAETPLSNENVLLLVKERPAGEVLDLLAAQFGYFWAALSKGKGYELRQSRRAREQEAKLREQDRRLALDGLDQELREQRQLLKLPRAKLQAQSDQLFQEERREGTSDQEQARLKAQREKINDCLSGELRPKSELLASLNQTQLQRLFEGRPVQFSLAGAEGMTRLPNALAQEFVAGHVDQVVEWYRTHPPRDVRAEVRMRTIPGGQLELKCRTEMIGSHPPGYTKGPNSPLTFLGKAPIEEAPPTPETSDSEDPRLTEQIQVTPPRKAPLLEDPSTYVEHTTLSDLLAAVSAQTPKLSFISDCTLTDLEPLTSKPKPVKELLSEVAFQAGSRWRFDPRGYVVLRSRRVHRNRVEAIPATVLRRYTEAAQPTGGLTLLGYARFAAELTDAQIDALTPRNRKRILMMFPLLRIHSEGLYACAGELRTLATLQPQELQALEQGRLLPVQSLGLLSRTTLARALQRRANWQESIPIEPVEALLPQMSLRLQVGPGRSNPAPPALQAYELEILSTGQEPLVTAFFEAMRATGDALGPQHEP